MWHPSQWSMVFNNRDNHTRVTPRRVKASDYPVAEVAQTGDKDEDSRDQPLPNLGWLKYKEEVFGYRRKILLVERSSLLSMLAWRSDSHLESYY